MKKLFVLMGLCIAFSVSGQSKYNVMAYYTGNAETLKQYPLDKITHVIYSFLKVQNDTLTFRDELQKQNVMQMVELKKEHPQLKLMVSVGGWGGCSFCSGMFDTASRRNTFVQTATALLKQYQLDGLDLDWEYPSIEGYPGHAYSPRDKDNFTAMVKELRAAMGHDYLLTFAAGGFTYYINESIDWAAVTPYVDYINLMTYDLVGGYSKTTGHHTATADYMPDQQSVTKCVNALLEKKVPASKLIAGAAFYGRVWQNVPDSNHGLYQPGNFLQGISYKNFDTYFTDSLGYTYYWDKKAKAPYQYSSTQKLFATFDDPRSINEKARFVRRKKLGGIMFWQLLDDKFSGGLTEEVWKDLNE